MSQPATPGPEVDVQEDLYRCITTPAWWVPEENRPSSAAFKQPDFSTDMVSIARTPTYTLSRFPPGCGLVLFNYGDAKAIGFLARREMDPAHPENLAHANVYNRMPSGSKRKTMAQMLVEKIVEKNTIVMVPNFPASGS
jgi:hypothetical protein